MTHQVKYLIEAQILKSLDTEKSFHVISDSDFFFEFISEV